MATDCPVDTPVSESVTRMTGVTSSTSVANRVPDRFAQTHIPAPDFATKPAADACRSEQYDLRWLQGYDDGAHLPVSGGS